MQLMSRRSALGALAAPVVAPPVAAGRSLRGTQPAAGVQAATGPRDSACVPRPARADAVTHNWTSFLGPP